MKLGGFSGILRSMFTDKMSIFRYIDVLNSDSTTETTLSDTPLYADVKCKISFPAEESPKDKDIDDTPIQTIFKIFCGTDIDLKSGDLIIVQKLSDTGTVMSEYSGKIGLPSMYTTHQEALLYLDGSA